MCLEYQIRMEDIAHNIFVLKKQASVPVWGVIKLDGYGMGLLFMAGMLRAGGIDRFAVSTAEDLAALRRAGFTSQDILLLSPAVSDAEIQLTLTYNGIFSIGSLAMAERIEANAMVQGCRARAHIQIDSGLGRFGFLPEEYPLVRGLYHSPELLSIEGIYSHFSSAGDKRFTRLQFERFSQVLRQLEADGIDRGMAHICNSPAIFAYPEMALDAVRAGSALVGRVAGFPPGANGLRPVGQLAAPVASVKTLPRGYHSGYGKHFALRRDTPAAVLPAGRWAGLPALGLRELLHISPRPSAVLCGQRVPYLGNPGENSVVLDARGLAVHPGDLAYFDISPLRLNAKVPKHYL